MLRTILISFSVVTAGLFFAAGSCDAAEGEGEGEGEGDEGEGDEGEGDCPDFVPPPNNPCIPTCGNEEHVGQPCTKSGGECNDYIGNGAGFCTADFIADFDPAVDLAYCTRPCGDDADCGTGGSCTADPEDPDGQKGCIPTSCLEEDGGEGEGEGE